MIHDSAICRECFCFVVGDNFYGKRRLRSKILVISIADAARVGKGGVRGTLGGEDSSSSRSSWCGCACVCVCVCAWETCWIR